MNHQFTFLTFEIIVMTGIAAAHICYSETLLITTYLFLLFLIVAYESSLKRPRLLTYCDVLSYFDSDSTRHSDILVSTVTNPIALVFGSIVSG